MKKYYYSYFIHNITKSNTITADSLQQQTAAQNRQNRREVLNSKRKRAQFNQISSTNAHAKNCENYKQHSQYADSRGNHTKKKKIILLIVIVS
jgi:hypothetical protein